MTTKPWLLLLTFLGLCTYALANQLTLEGDLTVEGDTVLEESLTVLGNDGVVFKGTFGQGSIPFEGTGPRMMWYPGKAAFRVGSSGGSAWHDSNVGAYSTAWGAGAMAKGSDSTAWGWGYATGEASTAWGEYTGAWGYVATAWGIENSAGGSGATAWGEWTSASGYVATAWGFGASAQGTGATGWGEFTSASGGMSTAWGFLTLASGGTSTAWGEATRASGRMSTAWGEGTYAESAYATALGRYNIGGGHPTSWVETDPLFEIGNGDDDLEIRANALTVLKNGRTTLQNKFWDEQDPMAVPTSSDASDGEALVVNGHARFAGRVWIEPQGDIPMFGQ